MYRQHPEGEIFEYQGLQMCMPPVGYVYDIISGEWIETGVYKRSGKKSQQYWEPFRLPEWFYKKEKEEKKRMLELDDPEFYFDDLEEIRKDHWFKRLNGMWFYNNGEPTYITGDYYFYINFWSIDIGLPLYRDSDRYNYYFRDYCLQDPDCFGWAEIAGRRDGKTYKMTQFLYEGTSRTSFANAGIQSKTGPDAKVVFSKLVSSFKKLPKFFQPVYDQSLGSTPKSELRFYRTSKKGKQALLDELEEELESVIDFRSSDTNAYDGYKLYRYGVDEIFKTSEVDIYKRWDAHRECLVDPISNKIIGKALLTSTVDLIEGQMDTYRRFWRDSDQTVRNANNRTVTGLYRHFRSAAESMQPDRYGRVDVERNTKFILSEREGKKNDPQAYEAYVRRYPLSIEDALRVNASNCLYNALKLSDRYDILSIVEDKFIRGNFEWSDDSRKQVIFIPMKNGKFRVSKDLDMSTELWNQVRWEGGLPYPKNKAKYSAGLDPFDHYSTEDGRKSKGAFALFYNYDPLNPLKSDKFIVSYLNRPAKPSILYEDILKACWFFGTQVLFENNKPAIQTYFESQKATKFLYHIKGRKEPGIPGSTATHDAIFRHTLQYIEDCIDQVDFIEMLDDWMEFDIKNTTKFDMAMATGYALIQADRINIKQEETKEEIIEVTSIFRTY
jgi:hypothetical protein